MELGEGDQAEKGRGVSESSTSVVVILEQVL